MPAMEAISDKRDLLAPEGTNDRPSRGTGRPLPSLAHHIGRNGCCLALAPGEKVICTATFDQEERVGQVVDIRKGPNKTQEYFVHYEDCDKRCDEWIAETKVSRWTEAIAANIARKRPAEEELPRDAKGRVLRAAIRKFDSGKLDSKGSLECKDGEKHQEHVLRARHTEAIDFGDYEICTWYQAPLPEPYYSTRHLYFCPYTMKYFRKRRKYQIHLAGLTGAEKRPPGDRIYESPEPSSEHPLSTPGSPHMTAASDPPVSMYEVDGSKHRLYCQNLCLLSKMFLDGKSLVWDVQEFDFFVLCERTPDNGEAMVGYYSREKRSETNCLACILTMPHRQKRGYGGLLIDFSYEMARRMHRPGVPERPISDLGEKAFFQYWERKVTGAMIALAARGGHVDLDALALETGIAQADIIVAFGCKSRLAELKLVHWHRTEYVVDIRSVDVLHELHGLLTSGRHVLVVDPRQVTGGSALPAGAAGCSRPRAKPAKPAKPAK